MNYSFKNTPVLLGDDQTLLQIYQSDLQSAQWAMQNAQDDYNNDPSQDNLDNLNYWIARVAAIQQEIIAINGNPNYQSDPQNINNNAQQIQTALQNNPGTVVQQPTTGISSLFSGFGTWGTVLLIGAGIWIVYDTMIAKKTKRA